MAIREYILTTHILVVARNAIFEEIPRKENEYFESKTLFTDVLIVSIWIEYQFRKRIKETIFCLVI